MAMKKKRRFSLLGIVILTLTTASAQNDWDFDDIYSKRQQIEQQRKKVAAQEKAERERLEAEHRKRQAEWEEANRENSRYVYQDEGWGDYDEEDEYYDPSDQD